MSIIVDNISYIYEKGTGFERQALKNVSCAIEDGEFIGLIGHTGSGKSTFIQHLNGLVKPTEGHIYYNGRDIYEQGFNMKELRSRVGLVFQYPNTSFLRLRYSKMYVLVLRTLAFHRRRLKSEHLSR